MSEHNLPKIISFYSNKSKHKTVQNVTEKIGSERIKLIKFMWKNLKMKKHGHCGDGDYGYDILKSMLKIGLTTSGIQSMINIGCSLLTRIRNNLKTNNNIIGDTSHHLSSVTLDIFKSFF